MGELNVKNRTIFCNDNLEILRGINSECIDLIYLDPPFNKNKDFIEPIGAMDEKTGFVDKFGMKDVKDEYVESIKGTNELLYNFLNAKESKIHANNIKKSESNSYMQDYCYLVYMAIRIVEIKRVLKNTGSIYLHCDHTMSHSLKELLDIIFRQNNFRNEIIWCYHGPGNPYMKQFNKKSDTIFWYSKGDKWTFNKDSIRLPFKDSNQSLRKAMSISGEFSEKEVIEYREKGKIPENWWEMRIAARSKKEYVGYPTQKPLKLLERIIKASSNEGDIVLDPFCGCATTCVAAERLNRKWIGIDKGAATLKFIIQRLKKYVDPNLFDISAKVNSENISPTRTDNKENSNENKGYVYIISNKSYPNWYKIGISGDYNSRLNTYQTASPFRDYKLEYTLHTSKFVEIEKEIHNQSNCQGEWVNDSLENIKNKIEELNNRY